MAEDEALEKGADQDVTTSARGIWNGSVTAISAGTMRRSPRQGEIVAFGAAIAVLLITAAFIDRHHVGAFETSVFHSINDLPPALYWPVWLVMQLGNLLAVPAAAIVALLGRRVRLSLALVLSGAGAWVLAKVVKQIVYRGRPGQLLSHVVLRHAPAAGHGFVAGHAATAFALAAVAFPYLGRRARWVAVTLAVLVSIARVYVGAHLPLDVIGGAALGIAVGTLVNVLLGPGRPWTGHGGGRYAAKRRSSFTP